MARKTTFPSPSNITDPTARQILELYMGQRGTGLDKVLTLRDLSDIGLITTRSVGGSVLLGGMASGVGGAGSGTGTLSTPSAPTGLAASGALGGVNLSWDASSDSYYAYTEVLRAAVDDAGLATVVGKSIFNGYRDDLWSSSTLYYWIRFVNSDGVTVKTGPLNGASGTSATVGEDPAFTLSVLTGNVTESQLYGALNTRIDLVDTPTTGLVDRLAAAEGNIVANDNDITALQSSTGSNSTNITTNSGAISALDTRVTTAEGSITANSSSITTLESTVNNGTTGVAANASGISSLDTRVTTAEGSISTNATDITALETTVNDAGTGVSANASAVSALEVTVNDGTSGVSANASNIATLQTSVGNNTASISTEQSARVSADNLLNAEYTLKLDVNGHIAGMGVAVSGGGSGPITSDILMLADRFAIGLPAATWLASQAYTLGQYVKPSVATGFVYKCTVAGTTGSTEPTWPTVLTNTVVDGTATWETVAITETIPFIVGTVGGSPAVVMDTAIIADASIGNAKIGDLNADKITTGDLTATLTINGGAIYGGTIATVNGSGYRAEMSGLDAYKFWAGTGTKNDANAIFYVKNDGSGKFSGNLSVIKPTYASTTFGVWVGDDAGTPKLNAGGANSYLKMDGSKVELRTGDIATKSIDINPGGDNELHFYSNRGDGTVEELATIGISAVSSDSVIGFFGSSNSGNSKVAVYGLSYSKTAVIGSAGTGIGVSGFSTSGYGVKAESTNLTGIYGTTSSANNGVHGENTGSGDGVRGTSAGAGDGVSGEQSGSGSAVYGYNSGTGIGVFGKSVGTGSTQVGVRGLNTGTGGIAIYGSSLNGLGGFFTGSDSKGGLRVSNGIQIDEQAGSPTGLGTGTNCRMYMKSDKLVIAWKDSGGTTRYKYLPLGSSTSILWVHTTTAP